MKRVRYPVLLAVAAGAFACDSETASLTLEEATAILAAVVDLANRADEGTNVEPCELGGGVEIFRMPDSTESGDTTWVSLDVVVNPGGCEMTFVGDTLSLTGDPSVTLDLERWYAAEAEEGEFDLVVAGAVAWWRRSDGSSDRCEVDLDLRVALGPDTNEDALGELAGLLCGHDAEIPWPRILGIVDG